MSHEKFGEIHGQPEVGQNGGQRSNFDVFLLAMTGDPFNEIFSKFRTIYRSIRRRHSLSLV